MELVRRFLKAIIFALLIQLPGATPMTVAQESGSAALIAESRVTPSKDYPKRAITIMAPASPGGGWDQLARVMQHALVVDDITSVPVEVVNRGGAGGTIGLTELITQHRRDPYTWMVGGSTLVSAMVMHESRFTLSEATLLARLASEYDVVAVPVDSPYQSMEDLISDFRKDPSGFVWGGGSAGSADHLMVALIAQDIGVDPRQLNYVAYPGGGEAAAAVMGQQIQAGVAGFAEWKDLAEAGRMRLLAISAPQRLENVEIPTLRESGLDVELENWRFVVAGPGVPDDDRAKILQMLAEMRGSAEWKKVLKTYSWEDRYLTGPALDDFVAAETKATAALLEDLGMSGGAGASATGPYLFPTIVTVLLTVCGLVLLGQTLMRRRLAVETGSGAAHMPDVHWPGFAFSAGLILTYVIALGLVGFLFATPVYLVLQARIIGSRTLLRDITIFVIFTAAVYFVFENLLSINVP